MTDRDVEELFRRVNALESEVRTLRSAAASPPTSARAAAIEGKARLGELESSSSVRQGRTGFWAGLPDDERWRVWWGVTWRGMVAAPAAILMVYVFAVLLDLPAVR